jgi:DNA-binding NtrC family response regulator
MASLLIVDDDPRIQELLRRWLKPAGYTLRFAENANVALAAIAEQQPAVIVCDIHMPGPNGLWLADRVRDIAPTTAILLATGDGNVPPFETLRRGVVAYVLKPFQRDQFLRAVSTGVAWSQTALAGDERRAGGERRRLPGAHK